MWKTGFKELQGSRRSTQSQSEFIRCQRRSSYRFPNRCLQPRPEGAQGGPELLKTQRETTLSLSIQSAHCASFWASFSSQRHYQSTRTWSPWELEKRRLKRKKLWLQVEKTCDQSFTLPPVQAEEENSSLWDHFLICDMGEEWECITPGTWFLNQQVRQKSHMLQGALEIPKVIWKVQSLWFNA